MVELQNAKTEFWSGHAQPASNGRRFASDPGGYGRTVLAILALHPTVAQLEEARVWLNGEGDVLGKEQRPLAGVVAEIFDILKVAEDEPPLTGP